MQQYTLSYKQFGKPDGYPIVLLHGFLGCKEDFLGMISCLEKTYLIYAIDLPGHGASSFRLFDDPFLSFAIQCRALFDDLSIRSCTLIAYSLGGRLALYLAKHFPEKIDALIAVSSHLGLQSLQEKRLRLLQDRQRAKDILDDYPLFLENWYKQPIFQGIQSSTYYHEMIKKRMQNHPESMAESLLAFSLAKQKVFSPQKKILFLCGEKDVTYQALYQKRNCSYKIVPGTSHAVHVENPTALASFAEQFITSKELVCSGKS